ncbi:hypothetical protein [Frigoribacterium sp. VKM Ac-2530]|uniref:hypothetical protein n=1 Tax=Frigoribacterium sp. VKM Ac-2530 TaxID=2783822 RepID=UPI00188A9E08|nr:hypothetical protein [Frigoribacterium sp. VKM Ac-2530]MBF4578917.1 hypothetical protein [Frigoribacterium sp. VKM Ac-2530]
MTDQGADAPFEPHTLELTIDHRHGISHKFRCIAPEGANCRLVCPDGCEEFSVGSHLTETLGDDRDWLQPLPEQERAALTRRHTLIDGGDCNPLLFLENDEAELWELYDGEPTGARAGHVALTWNGDYVSWHYLPHPIDDPIRAEIEARDKEA